MRLTRREFLEIAAVTGAGALAAPASAATPSATVDAENAAAVLVDSTRCIGCRSCEAACSEANGLPEPERMGDDAVFEGRRDTSPDHFTVVRRASPAKPGEEARFAKTQCLHCLEPACASACPVRALEKTDAGPVVYHADRCMGCRYCMISCPFDVPKYQYERAVPYVRKCTFCAPRLAQGKPPACAEACPAGALTFGKRGELLEEARRRIYSEPGKYVRAIYGEHEAGGTSWLYIADRRFADFAFPQNVDTKPYPELVNTALGAVPVILTLGPPILMALHAFASRRAGEVREEERHG